MKTKINVLILVILIWIMHLKLNAQTDLKMAPANAYLYSYLDLLTNEKQINLKLVLERHDGENPCEDIEDTLEYGVGSHFDKLFLFSSKLYLDKETYSFYNLNQLNPDYSHLNTGIDVLNCKNSL